MMKYRLTMPDGTVEDIPHGVCPVWRSNNWCATNAAIDVQSAAADLSRAEREAQAAVQRRDYLRGLMQRVLMAEVASAKAGPRAGFVDPATIAETGSLRAEDNLPGGAS